MRESRDDRVIDWLSVAAVVALAGMCLGCRSVVANRPVVKQVVILGFDGADPKLLSGWEAEGQLPNLKRLGESGTFGLLGTTNPPESPVAWATFATGLNPGGTGIFDFLTRDPQTYLPELSLTTKEEPTFFLGLIPIRPARVINERFGTPFYKAVAAAGYKTTVIRMPLEFPPTPLPGGKLWSGLGVPDVCETWGTFFYFASDLTQWETGGTEFGGNLVRLELNDNRAASFIEGPRDPSAKSFKRVTVPVDFEIVPGGKAVRIGLSGRTETVADGHWSGWFRVSFKVTPFLSIRAITRFYVLEVYPDLRLYMLPLNIDPDSPAFPVSEPPGYIADLVRKHGLMKTLGWWHDTWPLNEERIDEGVFLDDLMRTDQLQADVTLDELANDPPDLLISIFTGTDSASHMFYRLMDRQHPRYDPSLARQYGDAVLRVYKHMDAIVADVQKAMMPGAVLIIVSDHGFHTWRKGFNTNTWLVENGYMTLKALAGDHAELVSQGSFFPNVDWSRTRAYAVGLGQIYLNLKGREKFGIVDPSPASHEVRDGKNYPAERDRLLNEIRRRLLTFRDPKTGELVIENVYLGAEIFHGPRMSRAPDLQIAFRNGYRTSWQTSLGAIPADILVTNMKKWSGDHCASDPRDTSGIFLSNRLLVTKLPTITDIAPTVLDLFHVSPPTKLDGQVLRFREP